MKTTLDKLNMAERFNFKVNPGCLYIVATPIGNRDDITIRALSVLSQVDFIAAEDTRHTGLLLQEYGIKNKLISLHDHNEDQKSDLIIEHLKQNDSIALVSDAGTPLINDPGYLLVKKCHQHDIKVIPIPGACAAIAALSASGLPTNKFSYEGFLSAKKNVRQKQLNDVKNNQNTMIFYESTHRLMDCLNDMQLAFGCNRTVVLAKELTKTWETILQTTLAELINWLTEDSTRQKGEFVIIVNGEEHNASEQLIPKHAQDLLALVAKEMPLKKACAIVAEHYQLSKNDLYKDYLHSDEKSF